MYKNYYIPEEEIGARLDRFLIRKFNLSYNLAQKHLRTGAIKVNNRKAAVNYRLEASDKITLYIELSAEKVENPRGKNLAKKLQENILYEDEYLVVLNKPSGLASQGGSKIALSVDDALPYLTNKKLHLVHRLDKDTAGLLLLAKGSKVAATLTGLFKNKTIKKQYLAITSGELNPKKGIIDNKLSKTIDSNYEAVTINEEGQRAITEYELLDYAFQTASLVLLTPLTGRTHQLRVHCKALSCPIIGDNKYNPTSEKKDKLHLLSYRMEFTLYNKKYNFTAPLPAYFLDTMRFYGLRIPV